MIALLTVLAVLVAAGVGVEVARRRRLPAPAKVIAEVIRADSSAETRVKVIESPKLSAKVLIPPRPDGGTALAIELESLPAPLAELISRSTPGIASAQLLNLCLDHQIREGAVELRCPGQMRLLIWPGWIYDGTGQRTISRELPARAELEVGSRALDTHAGVAGWADVYLRWAIEVLHGEQSARPRPSDWLAVALDLGWRVSKLDIAAEVTSLDLQLADAAPERWTSSIVPHPSPTQPGPITSLDIGTKCKHEVSLACYRKDLLVAAKDRGRGLLDRWDAAGWDRIAQVWRVEVRLRRTGLQLRKRGAEDSIDGLDLTDPTCLADPIRLARAWAFVVGRPAERSGRYRLTLPTHREKRLCDVDPRWIRVQEAGEVRAPIETLVQVELRRRTERADYERKAELALRRALAARVGHEVANPETAGALAVDHARRIVSAAEWSADHQHARAGAQDLSN